MDKSELITSISGIVRGRRGPNGYYYGPYIPIIYNDKEYSIFAFAFSELPEDHGKLFFRITRNHFADEHDILADEFDQTTLSCIYNLINQ